MRYRLFNDRSLRQVQKLRLEQKLTPRQVLQIRITQIPRLELEHLIYQELESNPMLEIFEDEELDLRTESAEEVKDKLQEEIKKFFEEDYPAFFAPTELKEQPEKQTPYISTLSEHLKSELRLETSDPTTIEIGEYIIDSLNNDGFLDIPIVSISEYFGVRIKKVEKINKLIQSFDPPGIAARNPRESIQLQMEREPKKWKLELKIVKNYWDYYENNDIEEIAKRLNIKTPKVKKALSKIQKINPRPTSHNFGEIRYVIPNIIVTKKGENYEIAINEPNLPFLRLNTKYLHILQSPKDFDKKTVNFVKKWMDRAIFVLRCFEMRKRNFRNVVNFIIGKQKEFLEKGVMFMNPLRLVDIATATNLNESTISRYIKDTYIQTPRGVFHLKHFLSGRLEAKGRYISTNVIREKIKRMTNKEGEVHLTDDEIVDTLSKEGIDISRRTVTKYRKQMGIPSSRKRKREKKLYD